MAHHVCIGKGDMAERWVSFEKELLKHEIAVPQMLGWREHLVLVTAPAEILQAIQKVSGGFKIVKADLCSVTLTCAGSFSSGLWQKVFAKLQQHKLDVREIRTSALSATVFLDQKQRAAAIAALHELI